LRENIWPDGHQGILIATVTGMRKTPTSQQWHPEVHWKGAHREWPIEKIEAIFLRMMESFLITSSQTQ